MEMAHQPLKYGTLLERHVHIPQTPRHSIEQGLTYVFSCFSTSVDWYQGLSKLFLSVPAPKVLLLAGTDRLDQELTIGQMQGKFQMCLLPQAGHVIQEDVRTDSNSICSPPQTQPLQKLTPVFPAM